MPYNRLAEVVFILRPAGPLADLARAIDDKAMARKQNDLINPSSSRPTAPADNLKLHTRRCIVCDVEHGCKQSRAV